MLCAFSRSATDNYKDCIIDADFSRSATDNYKDCIIDADFSRSAIVKRLNNSEKYEK